METKHNETVYKMANHNTYSQLCSKPADDLSIDVRLLHKKNSWTDNIFPFPIHLTPILIESKGEANQVLSFADNEEEFYSTFLPGSVKGEEFCFKREKDPGQLLPASAKVLNVSDKVLSFSVTLQKYCVKRQEYCVRVQLFCVTVQKYCATVQKYCDQVQKYCVRVQLFCVTVQNYCAKVQKYCDQMQKHCVKVQLFCVTVRKYCATVQKYCVQMQKYCVTPKTFTIMNSRHRYTEAFMPPPWNMVNVPGSHYLLITNIKSNANKN
jgi:hypothetical protein